MKLKLLGISILAISGIVGMGWLSASASAKEARLHQPQSEESPAAAELKGIGTSPGPRGRR